MYLAVRLITLPVSLVSGRPRVPSEMERAPNSLPGGPESIRVLQFSPRPDLTFRTLTRLNASPGNSFLANTAELAYRTAFFSEASPNRCHHFNQTTPQFLCQAM
jgi:hypothetical protein